MINFSPSPILLDLGFWQIRWYGFFIAVAFVAGVLVLLSLGKKKNIKENDLYDLALWLVIGGVIGARVYQVFILNWSYYISNLSEIIKIWHGGLAIHGAIIGGLVALGLWLKTKEKKIFWTRYIALTDLLVAPIILGQAIGRWGNYFNQELFGRPTSLSWGIYIAPENRPVDFVSSSYFQPTFFYESVLDLVLFFILWRLAKSERLKVGKMTAIYLLGYGLIRFALEFIRIDQTALVFGLRTPQIVAFGMALVGGVWLFLLRTKK